MSELLNNLLAAYGGVQAWKSFHTVHFKIVSSGKLFDLHGFPRDLTPRSMTVGLHQQYASVQPFGAADRKTNFTAERVAIETLTGSLVDQRSGTPDAIHQHLTTGKWDPLDRAYFNGYALWTYMTTPFFLLMDGVEFTQLPSIVENEEVLNGIRVSFPAYIATHCQIQDFYFDESYLIRRHDYHIDVAGQFDAAQYLSDYVTVDGIKLPTRRRAYKKDIDGNPLKEELMVAIDILAISFE